MQHEDYRSADHVLEEVRAMRVRGGSAFGIAAAQAFQLVARDQRFTSVDSLFAELDHVSVSLLKEKPTMATIHNAYQLIVVDARVGIDKGDLPAARKIIIDRAQRFIHHSENAVQALGQTGANLIMADQTIMMHSFSGSVMAVFEAAWEAGKRFQVICTESRPLREGRFAASQLSSSGVPVTFITDASMAEAITAADWILVGADSIALDGAVANKMGTNLLSIVAERFQKPFYVAAEVLKLQRKTQEGEPIMLEQRPAAEVALEQEFEHFKHVTVRNQFFDLTPPQRIRAIITEQGVFSPGQVAQAWRNLQMKFEGIR